MATKVAKPKSAEQVIAGLRRRQPELVDAYMRVLVPDYERSDNRKRDLREAADLIIGMLLRALSERRDITAGEFAFARSYLRRGLLRGATEMEMIRAARLWQRAVVDAVNDLAGPSGGAVVAELSLPLIDYVDALSDMVAETVEEINAALRLTARDGRAELVEDLLAGRPPAAASATASARACSLDDRTPIAVISARPVVPYPDPAAASIVAVALAHARGDAVEPLFAIRGDETVVIRATADEPQLLVDALEAARRRLELDGVVLAVGVSALHEGLRSIPAAYAEACVALDSVATGGLRAIAVLDPLEYLFVRGGDDTAWSLVDPIIRAFVEDDLAQAGLLVDTFSAYIACNLNVKQAAEKLFVHANTAHYRLAKVEEITGRDLRDLMHLQELVVAIRLARMRQS